MLLGRREHARLHHGRARKPEALKQCDAQALCQRMLCGAFYLFGNQLGTRMAAGELDQHRKLAGRDERQINLDVVSQRQPVGIQRLQHSVIEGQMKALGFERLQHGQTRCDFVQRAMAQRRDFKHHFVGGQQIQVFARQAFMRAVHKHELGVHQVFLARMGERREDQRCIGRQRVVIGRA